MSQSLNDAMRSIPAVGQVIEAVRQLQREGGARQVEKCDNALVTGIGTVNYLRNWHSSAVMVLEV